jgi:hypothetical protein
VHASERRVAAGELIEAASGALYAAWHRARNTVV